MDTHQLRRILSRCPCFLGVYASDKLPTRIRKYPSCFVANVDPSTLAGSHWVAFYITSPTKLEFFDSYGHAPEYFEGPLAKFSSKFQHVTFNSVPLQSSKTAVCGQYCVYYLLCKCRHQTLNDIVSSFANRNIGNDVRVYNYVSKRFHVRPKFFQ